MGSLGFSLPGRGWGGSGMKEDSGGGACVNKPRGGPVPAALQGAHVITVPMDFLFVSKM